MKIYKIKNAILKCYKHRRFILLSKERGRKTKFKKKIRRGSYKKL